MMRCSGTEIAYGGTEIAYGGTEVAYGGTEVAYGGTEIAYGGTEVAYGGTEIAYGGTDIAYGALRRRGSSPSPSPPPRPPSPSDVFGVIYSSILTSQTPLAQYYIGQLPTSAYTFQTPPVHIAAHSTSILYTDSASISCIPPQSPVQILDLSHTAVRRRYKQHYMHLLHLSLIHI
eukprot:298266-Rhodomonas_salina.1